MRRIHITLLLAIYCLSFFLHSEQETVDRIVALVNDQVITLTDLKIAEAFRIYDEELEGFNGNSLSLILEKLISQKLVIQLSSEKVSVEKEKLDMALKIIIEKMGMDEVERKMAEFGLDWEDLRESVWEKILYQTILSQRFSRVIIVSLKEIEDYYHQVYIPTQKEKGADPKPMIEILDEIESILRQERIKEQVEEWLENLKKNANIQVKREALERFKS